MYEYLKGKIKEVTPYYVIVEVAGIGFKFLAPNPYSFSEQIGKSIKVYVHQVIREDAHTLYGFKAKMEKALFLKLISVSGIGPKSALAILASKDYAGIIKAINQSDANYLTKFPGVGKKTASQMILDLKGKLEEIAQNFALNVDAYSNVVKTSKISKELIEALEALAALGYANKDIKKIEKGLVKTAYKTTDQYLRQALRML
ncbi:MAG: Holliday junction branch migration protein RuvA [Streptococcaceae bacterium]|jgi:Holliday junction DNA helicase RuvA|nr:Holliday junction branch migration protein RuvA [Streptococcaceae bacterium]